MLGPPRIVKLAGMPRNLGPELLANLDRQRAEGTIDQGAYEARRAEVETMIRKGQAYSLSRTEKLVWAIAAALLAVAGVLVFALAIKNDANILGLIFGAGLLSLAANRVWVLSRH